MRCPSPSLALLLAVSTAALAGAIAQPAAAQEICLYGGPDAAADLACGPAYVAPVRTAPSRAAAPRGGESRGLSAVPAGPSAVAESRILSGLAAGDGAAQSRILSGGAAGPAAPAPAAGFAPLPAGDAVWAYAPDFAPPPPPAFDAWVAAEDAAPGPGAYAYAYESLDGGAFAWRYDTAQGPAWAYAYQTPEGWAYAYAWDNAPDAPPPAVIEARAPEHGVPHRGDAYRGPYVERTDQHYVAGADWRYSEERLFGAAFRQQLYLVQTWRRESEWVAVSAIPGRRYLCGGCVGAGPVAGPYAGPYAVSGQRGVLFAGGAVSGFGRSGFAPSGGFLVSGSGGAASRASQSFSVMNTASQTSQAQATATGNQTVTAGTPFTPPSGAVPPWGPPAQIDGANTANAFAGAGAATAAAGAVSARAGR